MARILTNDGTQISGKLSEVVYVRYRGGIYIRKAPKKRRDAREPKMLLNQQRFAAITRFCVQFKQTLIKMIWNDKATTNSGYNLFLKTNSPTFGPDGHLDDPLLIKLSIGDLSMPEALSAHRTIPDSDTIQVSWQKQTHISGTRTKDELMAICSDGEAFSAMTPTGIKRKDLQGAFELPAIANRAEYLYLFFASEDRRSFSDSLGVKI